MKYVISWKAREGGSAADNEAAAERGLAVFSKWSPHPDVTFHQFVARIDGGGGYAVVESDNPLSIAEGPTKFEPYFVFDVVPVVDMADGVPVLAEAIEFRKSIS